MLEDRAYMRRAAFAPRWSLTVLLVIANIAAFILQNALYRFSSIRVDPLFALSVDGISRGWVWQLVTFQFMHGGILHLLFNCLAIYMFGRDVEDALRPRSFLTLYFSSGIVGGILQVALDRILASVLHAPNYLLTSVVGASAGAFGLIAAFAVLYPDRPLMLFPIPITIKAKFLLVVEAVFAVVGIIIGGGNVAHAAHLGGIFTGIVFVRYAVHWHWPQFNRNKRRPLQRLVKVPSTKSSIWNRTKPSAAEDLPPEEFVSKEVDPILDKISAHGIQSLTERERRILEAAREKMAKR